MKRLALVVAVAFGATGLAHAEAKKNPTGLWKWTVERGGQSREMSLKLKLEGDQLSGVMLGRNGQETKIDDAKYKGGEVSFTVTRERNGQKFTVKYQGKVNGDSIKGKSEVERNGETQSRDWEAKRSQD